MFYFASLTLTELAPILTILAGMLLGFYGLLKFVLKQAEKDRDADREERKEFAEALKNVADANFRVAEATERSAREAEKRNGHLADISVENKKQILTAISGLTINEQTVHHQTVEHEKVMNKEQENGKST